VPHGNEPGTLKEVVSLNNTGPCAPLTGAFTVLIELGPAAFTGSLVDMNKAPTPGVGSNARGAGGAGGGGGSGSGSGGADGGPQGPSGPGGGGSGSGGSSTGASGPGGGGGGGDDGKGGGGDDDGERRNLRKLSNSDVKNLQKNGYDPHEIKDDCGCRPNSRYDLFKNRGGDVFVNDKANTGEPIATGINLNNLTPGGY
jgi:Bacterial toxin 33/Domain of unknown function (DUF4150)